MPIPGPGDVLALVRSGRATTRAEVQEHTGLSRVTVAQRVDALFEAGLLRDAGPGEATGGRRPTRLVFDVAARAVAAVALETAHARVAITDLAGRLLRHVTIPLDLAGGPEVVLDRLARAIRELLEAGSHAPLAGIGVSVPGPVHPRTGRLNEPPVLVGWHDYPAAERLAELVGNDVPVLLSRDASAMAYGERSVSYPDSDVLVLVKASTGIGAGIVIGGSRFEGADGGAGDLGHIKVPDARGRVCTCGATGCLATISSGRAVAAELGLLGKPARSGRDVRALLDAQDPDAMRLTQDAGRHLGSVLASVVALLNPQTLLLAGDLASAPLVAGVRESLHQLALPRATRHLNICLADLGDDAALVGLAALVVEQEFAPDLVNGRLS